MKNTVNTINPDKWMDNYYDYLKNYTRSRVRRELDLEEIISDTFFAALKSKDNFQGRSTERTWLTSILKHKIIDHYRKKSSYRNRLESSFIPYDEHRANFFCTNSAFDSEESALSEINLKSLEVTLAKILKNIPERQSEIIQLRVNENLTTEEICSHLNITKGNLWVLVCRARKSIAEGLIQHKYLVK